MKSMFHIRKDQTDVVCNKSFPVNVFSFYVNKSNFKKVQADGIMIFHQPQSGYRIEDWRRWELAPIYDLDD